MHAGTSNRRTHGFHRGFMRSLSPLRTSQGSGNGVDHQLGSINGSSASDRFASVIRFRDQQIEMAHGAGGKASRRLIEGLFAPLLFGDSTEPLGDAAHLNVDGT